MVRTPRKMGQRAILPRRRPIDEKNGSRVTRASCAADICAMWENRGAREGAEMSSALVFHAQKKSRARAVADPRRYDAHLVRISGRPGCADRAGSNRAVART